MQLNYRGLFKWVHVNLPLDGPLVADGGAAGANVKPDRTPPSPGPMAFTI